MNRRRITKPNPRSPAPSNIQLGGSGTALTGVPGTSSPLVVPNEKSAAVTVVAAVTALALIVNVTELDANGLCGPLPPMERLALQ